MPLEDKIVFNILDKDRVLKGKRKKYNLADVPELPDIPPDIPELKDSLQDATRNRNKIVFDQEIFEGAGRVPICPWCNMQIVVVNRKKVRGSTIVTCRYCDKVLGAS